MEKLPGIDNKVRKSNILVEGRYRFNLNEQKILLLILSRIKMDDKEFQPYRVRWDDLKASTKGKVSTLAKLDVACESLKNKTVKIKKGQLEDNFGFLSGWFVDPGKWVEFRLDPGMKSLLLDLLDNGNFTLYDLECVLSLNSTYSIRIYEILKSLAWKNQPVVLVLDELKWSLDISKESVTYSDFGNFRQFVLNRAQKDLEKHTDIKFDYQVIKEGRKVVALSFHIRNNGPYQKTVQGVIGKKNVLLAKKGDKVMIGGEVCEVLDGGVYYAYSPVDGKQKCLPIGELNQWIKKGKAKLIK